MVEKSFTIVNRLGIHARPAAQIVKTANRFNAEIEIVLDSMRVNAKSIMGVMTLAAARGCTIEVCASGDDGAEAVDALGELIRNKFGED